MNVMPRLSVVVLATILVVACSRGPALGSSVQQSGNALTFEIQNLTAQTLSYPTDFLKQPPAKANQIRFEILAPGRTVIVQCRDIDLAPVADIKMLRPSTGAKIFMDVRFVAHAFCLKPDSTYRARFKARLLEGDRFEDYFSGELTFTTPAATS